MNSSDFETVLDDSKICRILVSRDKFSEILLAKKLKSVNAKLIKAASNEFIRKVFETIDAKDVEEWKYF